MKILYLTNYYPPFEVGGYEQLCRDVALRLAARGHAALVLTSRRGTGGKQFAGEPGVLRLLGIQPRYDARLSPAMQFFLTRRHAERRNRRILCQVADDYSPDVIFIWNLEGLPHELALDAEAIPKVAVAYWLAQVSPAEPDLFWRYWTQPPQKRSKLASAKSALASVALREMRREGKPIRPRLSHVAVVSEYMLRRGQTDNTLPPNAKVIRNGVETEMFYQPPASPQAAYPIRMLLAGRVSSDKGVHVAVEAAGRLAQARAKRDFRLVIAGGGPASYRVALEQLCEEWRVADIVSFAGQLERERVPELMHSCQVLLLPTISPEPFARVVLEAMAAGLTVIGTVTGGTGELLSDGVNGLTFEPGDAASLARQIGRVLDDPQMRYRLALAGQATVLANYSMDHMTDQVEDLLTRAVRQQDCSGAQR